MESVKYNYIGVPCTRWDDKGSIYLSTSTNQKDLEYLYKLGIDNIVQVKSEDKPKK